MTTTTSPMMSTSAESGCVSLRKNLQRASFCLLMHLLLDHRVHHPLVPTWKPVLIVSGCKLHICMTILSSHPLSLSSSYQMWWYRTCVNAFDRILMSYGVEIFLLCV